MRVMFAKDYLLHCTVFWKNPLTLLPTTLAGSGCGRICIVEQVQTSSLANLLFFPNSCAVTCILTFSRIPRMHVMAMIAIISAFAFVALEEATWEAPTLIMFITAKRRKGCGACDFSPDTWRQLNVRWDTLAHTEVRETNIESLLNNCMLHTLRLTT